MKKTSPVIIAILFAVTSCIDTNQENEEQVYTYATPEIRTVDSTNVQQLIHANDKLVDMLNVISEKTNDPRTKSLSKELIDYHKNFNQGLASKAEDIGISILLSDYNAHSDPSTQNLKTTPYDEFQMQAVTELQNRYKTMFENLKYAQDETANPDLKNEMATHLSLMQKYIEIVFDSLSYQ